MIRRMKVGKGEKMGSELAPKSSLANLFDGIDGGGIRFLR